MKKQGVKKKHLTLKEPWYIITKVIKMNEILEQALLYDFYGELLTEHQKRIYEEFVIEDLSLSEIAEDEGISRQGVHDLIKRCNKALIGYEDKLHLVDKFLKIKRNLETMNTLLESEESDALERHELITKIRNISLEILEEL